MSSQLWVLVLSSAFLHATWNFAAKKAAGGVAVFWLSLIVSALFATPFAAAEMASQTIPWEAVARFTVTGLLTAAYSYALACAYRTGDLSFIYPISRGSGVAAAAFLGGKLLGDSIHMVTATGIGCVCFGTFVMTLQRRITLANLREVGQALMCGAFVALCAVNDKVGMQICPPGIYMVGFDTVAALALFPVILREGRASVNEARARYWPHVLVIGVGSAISYGLILMALQSGPIGFIVAARELAIVIGAVFGVVLLRETLTLQKAIGIIAIVFGLLLLKMFSQ